MTYHEEKVAEILREEEETFGRPVELLEASTIGPHGERVTTVVYELAPTDGLVVGRSMVERRVAVKIEQQHGGANRTSAVGLVLSTNWTPGASGTTKGAKS